MADEDTTALVILAAGWLWLAFQPAPATSGSCWEDNYDHCEIPVRDD